MKVYNQTNTYKMHDELKDLLEFIRTYKAFNPKEYVEDKCNLLNNYMMKYKLDTCVIAISGGIDSSVVLALAVEAQKMNNSPIKKIVPVSLPCFKNSGVTHQKETLQKGHELCLHYGVKQHLINMHDIIEVIRDNVEDHEVFYDKNGTTVTKYDNWRTDDWAIGQLVPYARTSVLYYMTSVLNAMGFRPIILGTTNLSEGGYLGYVGKASDGMVDVQLISDIYKDEVYRVAKYLDVPEDIISAVPTGDMYDSRSDIEVFGAPYDFVELYSYYLESELNELIQENINCMSDDAKKQFAIFAENLDNLHSYNKHKYLAGSPAVHLDLWDCNIKDGWCHKKFVLEE